MGTEVAETTGVDGEDRADSEKEGTEGAAAEAETEPRIGVQGLDGSFGAMATAARGAADLIGVARGVRTVPLRSEVDGADVRPDRVTRGVATGSITTFSLSVSSAVETLSVSELTPAAAGTEASASEGMLRGDSGRDCSIDAIARGPLGCEVGGGATKNSGASSAAACEQLEPLSGALDGLLTDPGERHATRVGVAQTISCARGFGVWRRAEMAAAVAETAAALGVASVAPDLRQLISDKCRDRASGLRPVVVYVSVGSSESNVNASRAEWSVAAADGERSGVCALVLLLLPLSGSLADLLISPIGASDAVERRLSTRGIRWEADGTKISRWAGKAESEHRGQRQGRAAVVGAGVEGAATTSERPAVVRVEWWSAMLQQRETQRGPQRRTEEQRRIKQHMNQNIWL